MSCATAYREAFLRKLADRLVVPLAPGQESESPQPGGQCRVVARGATHLDGLRQVGSSGRVIRQVGIQQARADQHSGVFDAAFTTRKREDFADPGAPLAEIISNLAKAREWRPKTLSLRDVSAHNEPPQPHAQVVDLALQPGLPRVELRTPQFRISG